MKGKGISNNFLAITNEYKRKSEIKMVFPQIFQK